MNAEELKELEKNAFHQVPVKVLKKYCNPLGCWHDIEKPITKKEVLECLKNGKEELVDTPFNYDGKKIDFEKMRELHIKKIAYFVKNDSTQSIDLDVGIPDLGCFVDYMIQDGNHRFAGKIIANKDFINCKISGSEKYIKRLGMWFPNENLIKLNKYYDQENNKKRKSNNKP